jgi:hypothetical protein
MAEKRTLTCELTSSELEQRGAELARCTFDWEEAEEQKKGVTKTLGDVIKNHEVNMKRLARIVRSGKEEREVEVEWKPFISSETMRQIRLDTGEEISSRPMTKEEKELYRQRPLPLVQPFALPAAGPITPEAPDPVAALPEHSEAIDAEFEEVG